MEKLAQIVELHRNRADFSEVANGEPGVVEAKQWLEAIHNDTEPLVKPEEAFTVTQILEAIYQSDREGREIKL